MSLDKQYSKEVRQNLRYFPVWEPGQTVLPGAIGELHGGVFHPQTSIEKVFPDLKIEIAEENDPADRHRGFQSRGCVQVRGEGGGRLFDPTTAQNVRLSGNIEFSREGAVVLDSAELASRRIANLHEVRDHLSKHREQWTPGYVLVTQVEDAGRFGVVMSNSENTTISLTGGSEAIAKCSLVDAGITVNHIRDGAYSMFGKGALLLRLYGFVWYRRRPVLLSSREPIPEESEAEFCEIHANDEQFDE